MMDNKSITHGVHTWELSCAHTKQGKGPDTVEQDCVVGMGMGQEPTGLATGEAGQAMKRANWARIVEQSTRHAAGHLVGHDPCLCDFHLCHGHGNHPCAGYGGFLYCGGCHWSLSDKGHVLGC